MKLRNLNLQISWQPGENPNASVFALVSVTDVDFGDRDLRPVQKRLDSLPAGLKRELADLLPTIPEMLKDEFMNGDNNEQN